VTRPKVSDVIRKGLAQAGSKAPVSGRPRNFITQQELLDVVNDGLTDLQELLFESSPQNLRYRVELPVVSGVDFVMLPEDCLEAVRVSQLTDGRRSRLTRWKMDDLEGTSGTTSSSPKWSVGGAQLQFLPAPSWSGTVELWYARALPRVSSEADYIPAEVPPGSDRYLAAYLAVYCLGKEESDPSPALLILQRSREGLLSVAARRTLASRVRGNQDIVDEFAARVAALPRY
jgi:hypothetical protein